MGLVIAHKAHLFALVGLNTIENSFAVMLGNVQGFTLESVLLSIAFGLVLLFILEKEGVIKNAKKH